MLFLTLILTPSFSSPISEGNSVSVRNDTCTATSSQLVHVRQPLLSCSIKKFKSINLNPSATLLSKQICDSSRHWLCSSIACLALNLETKLADLASLFCLQNWLFHLDWDIFSTTGLIPYSLLKKFRSLFPLGQRSDEACLIFPSVFRLALIGSLQTRVKLIPFEYENK